MSFLSFIIKQEGLTAASMLDKPMMRGEKIVGYIIGARDMDGGRIQIEARIDDADFQRDMDMNDTALAATSISDTITSAQGKTPAQTAEGQVEIMAKFFGSLDRQQRRELTRAAVRKNGKETVAEMMKRLGIKK